jgi:hypothetical protein
MKIRPAVLELLHADRQTDMAKQTDVFLQLVVGNAPKHGGNVKMKQK